MSERRDPRAKQRQRSTGQVTRTALFPQVEQGGPHGRARVSRRRHPSPGAMALKSTGCLCEERGWSGPAPAVPLRGAAATGPDPKPTSRIERRRAINRRRVKIVTVACAGFCALVLATSFPLSALLRQHQQISSATGELHSLTAANSSLQQEAGDLSEPANVAALARRDYDMVRPGQRAYTVLPLPGSSQSSGASSGHSSLDQGAVAPGSAAVPGSLG